jgi:hypothetical protein
LRSRGERSSLWRSNVCTCSLTSISHTDLQATAKHNGARSHRKHTHLTLDARVLRRDMRVLHSPGVEIEEDVLKEVRQ